MNWPDAAHLILARQKTFLSPVDINIFETWFATGASSVLLNRLQCLLVFRILHSEEKRELFDLWLLLFCCWYKQVVFSGFKSRNSLWNKSDKRIRRNVPVGKCSLIGQLSTCKVALPPFLVNRTKWYLPSFTGVLVSLTLMSTVPMLNVTPTLPCS